MSSLLFQQAMFKMWFEGEIQIQIYSTGVNTAAEKMKHVH